MRSSVIKEIELYFNELKTIKLEKTDIESQFLQIANYKCDLNNGQTIMREKLVKGNKDGSAVIILPITTENEVLLNIEPRVFTKRSVGLGLPAGYIENNETKEHAALRELEEETGYQARELIYLGGYYQDMGISSAYNELFLAKDCFKVTDQHLDNDEYVKYIKCTYEEAFELIDMNYIQGGNTIITLGKSKRYMKGR